MAARGSAATAAAASGSVGRWSTASVAHMAFTSAVTAADASAIIAFRLTGGNVRLPGANSVPYCRLSRATAAVRTHAGSGGSTIAW